MSSPEDALRGILNEFTADTKALAMDMWNMGMRNGFETAKKMVDVNIANVVKMRDQALPDQRDVFNAQYAVLEAISQSFGLVIAQLEAEAGKS